MSDSSRSHDAAFCAERQRMVDEQLVPRGIADARVLYAMRTVPREEFVPVAVQDRAYADCPLPIGHDQTISQPFTVAFMCQALQLGGGEHVLEIGTGSGYGAAVLSKLAECVDTIERIPVLAQTAQATLRRLHYNNVRVFTGDGTLGLPDEAPFDAIVVTAGGVTLPVAYAQQLRDGGRIIIPLGPAGEGQRMCLFTRRHDQLQREDLGAFSFVPLVSDHSA